MQRFSCDICGTAASTVFCHTDSTYLCSACDDFIHAEANPMAGHHFRVPTQITAYPSSSLLYGEFPAPNNYQAETTATASEEFFYYGLNGGECFDDLITLTSSCSDDVIQTSCGSNPGIPTDCDFMSVPVVHSLQLDQSMKSAQPRTKKPEVSTIQASSVCTPPNCQMVRLKFLHSFDTFVQGHAKVHVPVENFTRTRVRVRVSHLGFTLQVPKSVQHIRPEITLTFSTQSGQHPKAKRVERLAHPSAENSISREERVQRFRQKRQAKQMRKKINVPSKKAQAASIRPRINGKFARRAVDNKAESN